MKKIKKIPRKTQLICFLKRTKFVNKNTDWYRALCPVHTAHTKCSWEETCTSLPPSLARSLGTNGLSEHPGMVEIHTHVAAAPHLWVKEASTEHNTGREGQREIHTHNTCKVHKSS